jgi:hypothetical protein
MRKKDLFVIILSCEWMAWFNRKVQGLFNKNPRPKGYGEVLAVGLDLDGRRSNLNRYPSTVAQSNINDYDFKLA